jgi:hypothetical protein
MRGRDERPGRLELRVVAGAVIHDAVGLDGVLRLDRRTLARTTSILDRAGTGARRG